MIRVKFTSYLCTSITNGVTCHIYILLRCCVFNITYLDQILYIYMYLQVLKRLRNTLDKGLTLG